MYKSFHPGKVWLDTDGKRIQAHGGSVIFVNGKYYWYGENKEHTNGKDNIWHWGVRCYESDDLYNWKDKGLIIPPVENDLTSSLHPSSKMDRPHIIYNRFTKKYVCWLKIMGKEQTETVLTADEFLGPYTLVRENLRPLQMSAGDFDLAVADDGKAYYYFERVHSETICADLTPDYTDVTGYYSTHFPHHEGPPHVREAIAHFTRNGKQFLLTSGTTGYRPNPSEIAIGFTWHGPFKVLGNPHRDDKSNTSFHSQIASVFKVPNKKDLFIACADRWLPEQVHLDYDGGGNDEAAFRERLKKHLVRLGIDPLREPEKARAKAKELLDEGSNTSIADYVWLPLRFDGELPYIEWKDEWKLEDYE